MTRVGPMERSDVLAAYNLYLQVTHAGQFSREYERLCRLQTVFKPSHGRSSRPD